MKTIHFLDENQRHLTVTYTEVTGTDCYKPYGIKAELTAEDGAVNDTAVAQNRFATREECLENIEMMANMQVTPCTLCDVL